MARSTLHMPTEEAANEALEALQLLRDRPARRFRILSSDDEAGVEAVLPRDAVDLLIEILTQMSLGNAVNLVPIHAELTTQQAADLLGVSRPFFVSLLEQGKIGFRKVGTHRRVLAEDLIAYKNQDDAKRREAADALTKEAQDSGLEY